jgi:tetratricopeptide (TPR) repeat protein
MKTIALLTASIVLLVSGSPANQSHQHQHAQPGDLGSVHFPVSCAPAAQKTFNRGVALLHSFWYDEAGKTFAEVARVDPSCGMAWWGIAMSLYHPIWAPPTSAELKKGGEAVERAKAAGARTQRERDYIAAIEVFYKDASGISHPKRALAYRKGMNQLSARYSEDTEAAIFFALALLGTASPTDKTYANQKQAAAILNRILPAQPNHPGIAHYLIHSFDSQPLAQLALAAARSYAKIAPAAPHALHMPSHIFTRLGLWQDSIESNLASAAAAKNHVAKMHSGAAAQDQLHAMDYLVYAYLQGCQDGKARRVAAEAAAVSKVDAEVFQAAYAFAAIPARYALERRRWSEAAGLKVHPPTFPWERFRYAEAIIYFARAIGSARSASPAAARIETEKLGSVRKALEQTDGSYDWSAQVEVQRLAASAWVAHAEGNNEEAVRLMRSAAELEDTTEKHPVTPGAVLPARELLGDLFLELDQPTRALPEFETTLRNSPKRFNATYGAARAAELSGDRKKAKERYTELIELCADADSARLELQNAKAFLQR